jgi:hypothetical protein
VAFLVGFVVVSYLVVRIDEKKEKDLLAMDF